MAIRSGLAAQCGVAAESTFATNVASTSFYPFAKIALQKVKNTVTAAGITAGALGQLGAWRRVTTTAGKGSLEGPVVNRKMGLFLQALMGTTATPVQQAATAAYLQTHTLADTFGKSLSLQAGVPERSGTVRPYTLNGSKINDAEFTFEVDKAVTVKFGIDAQAMSEVPSLAVASYVTSRPFVGTDASFKVGATFGSEAAVSGVKKVAVKIDRGLKDDGFYLGASGLKAEQVIADYTKITGSIGADFLDKTVFADRFAADTGFYLVIEAVGALIASTYYDRITIKLPGCFLDGDTPTVDGVDVVSGDFPFTWMYDGTNLPVIEYMSTDVTLG